MQWACVCVAQKGTLDEREREKWNGRHGRRMDNVMGYAGKKEKEKLQLALCSIYETKLHT